MSPDPSHSTSCGPKFDALTNFRLIDRNQHHHHTDTPARDEPRDEKHGNVDRASLEGAADDVDQASQVHGLLPTTSFTHPADMQGSEERTSAVEAIDGAGDGIVVTRIVAEVEVGNEARLTDGVGDDREAIPKGKTP